MPEQEQTELFNLTEFAKQVREEVYKLEQEYKKYRGETDAHNGTNR